MQTMQTMQESDTTDATDTIDITNEQSSAGFHELLDAPIPKDFWENPEPGTNVPERCLQEL